MHDTRYREILSVLKAYYDVATFPAHAGDSCRLCKKNRDGGCTEPHDDECAYGIAEKKLLEMVKSEGVISHGLTQDQMDKAELDLLRKLEGYVRERHAMEPKHSREDHECVGCVALADLSERRWRLWKAQK